MRAAVDWVAGQAGEGPFLIMSSPDPDTVGRAQALLGREAAGGRFAVVMAEIAQNLVGHGVRRLLVAAGETSGAVVQALEVKARTIGPKIDPGVPWTRSPGEPSPALALTCGNFGSEDFF